MSLLKWSSLWFRLNHAIVYCHSNINDPQLKSLVQVKVWTHVSYKFPKSNLSYSDYCINVYKYLKSLL